MDRPALLGIAVALVAVPVVAAACGDDGATTADTLPPIVTTTTTTIVITTTTYVEVFYEVQSGDRLGNIAAQFGVSMADLMAANGITDPDYIQAGQVLTIPPATVVVDLPDSTGSTPTTSAPG